MVKKTISLALIMSLFLSLLPAITFPAALPKAAASEDIGSQTALDALGIDTSQLPEGFDPHTTDNPYGRDTVTINPVYELFLAGTHESVDGRHNALYGHNRPLMGTVNDFYSNPISTTQNDIALEATASASGNFKSPAHQDTRSGKMGQVVTVGVGALDTNGGLYLYFTDPRTGNKSGMKTLINPSNEIGNMDLMQENFLDDPYLMQNYLQITTGDFNNDGTHEVAVYVPERTRSRVEIYKLKFTSSSPENVYLDETQWEKVWTYYFNENPYVSNMVSLTAGDFNQDGIDDLALTWGYYFGPSLNSSCQAVVLYGDNEKMLQKKEVVDLTYNHSGIVRAAFTYGDVDGDNVKDLILGGQLASDITGDNLNTRFIGIYRYIDSEDRLILSNAENFNFFEKADNGKYIWELMERTGAHKDKFYSVPAMVANIATVNLEGMGKPLCIYFDSIIYEFSDEGLSIKTPLDIDVNFNKNINSLAVQSRFYVEYGIVVGDFTGDSRETLELMQYYFRGVATIPIYYRWWFIPLLGVTTIVSPADLDRIAVTENGCIRTDTAYFWTSFCKLNTDSDTTFLRYTGNHYMTYSDPRILAVLASAPYFADLEHEEELGEGNYMESETSFTTFTGVGGGNVFSAGISAGLYISYEKEFEVLGQKIGSIEWEVSFTSSFTRETVNRVTMEQGITFSTLAGADAVAFYSVPMETYVYEACFPIIDSNGNITYETQLLTVNIPFTANVKVLPLETYERIAADYPDLPQIAGKALTHTVGNPKTYPSRAAGYLGATVYGGTPAGVNFGVGSITQEVTISHETEVSHIFTHTIEHKAGGGPGDFKFGRHVGLEIGHGSVTVNYSGSTFSGTVFNMPTDAEPYGYNYTWRVFQYYHYDVDTGLRFPVVSYIVEDVKAPPKLPEDFGQDVVKTTPEEITLTWSYSGAAAGFQIYRYYEFPDGGGSYELQFISASDYVDADANARYYEFTDTGLYPYTDYTYQIQTIGTAVPPKSILSPVHTFRTKASEGYPDIVLKGVDNGKLLVWPDEESTVRIEIENIADYTQTPRYQWQKRIDGSWTDIRGAISEQYVFKSAGLADEGQYRCRVNVIYQSQYISDYSETFTVEYSKRTPRMKPGSFVVRDANEDGTRPTIEIDLQTIHMYPYHPSGLVVFRIVGSDYDVSYTVQLTPGLDGSKASLTLANPLPEGAYTITAYYSGSRVFKALAVDTSIPYLSGCGSGYSLTINSQYIYGDAINPIFAELTKENGTTISSPSTDTVQYTVLETYRVPKLKFYGFVLYWEEKIEERPEFIEGGQIAAAKHGKYILVASISGQEVARRNFTVNRREINIGIDDLTTDVTNIFVPNVSNLKLLGQSELAFNDQLSELGLGIRVTNTAGTVVEEEDIGPDLDPGQYVIVGVPKNTAGTNYPNYQITFKSGTYTISGTRYSVTGVSKLLNNKTVGAIRIETPVGNDNLNWTTKYSSGTYIIFSAQPFRGYKVKSWDITPRPPDVSFDSTMTIGYRIMDENITVSVEFEVAQQILRFGALDGIGGTVECDSNTVIKSGDVANEGAEFTFTAKPLPGYHFSEWRLQEIGKTPSKPVGMANPDGSNTCTISMGSNNTTLIAVFVRDSYQITMLGDLQASYYISPDIIGEDDVEVIAFSGAFIRGDKEVKIEPRPGHSVKNDAVWMQDGEPVTEGVSEDNQSYTFIMLSDTAISVGTDTEYYDVILTVSGPGDTENNVQVTVNGQPASPDQLAGLTGGSSLTFTPMPAYGYVFDKWIVDGVDKPENALILQALNDNRTVEAVFKGNDSYSITVDYNERGSLSYSLNGGIPVAVERGGTIPVFKGDGVVLLAEPERNFMVDYWKIQGNVEETRVRTWSFPDISESIAVEVFFVAQTFTTVTYAVSAQGGGEISATSDGNPFASGSNSVGNGSTIVFTAVPDPDKMVSAWTLNGSVLRNEFGEPLVAPTFTIQSLSGAANVVVSFADIVTHSVDIIGSNAAAGVQYYPELAGSAGRIRDGAAAVFTLVPDAGYGISSVAVQGESLLSFDNVIIEQDGTWICTLNSVNEDITVTYVTKQQFAITVNAVGGTVTGARSYLQDEEVTLIATANFGYRFVNWTEGGEEVCGEDEYVFTAEADRSLAANFLALPPPPPSPPAPLPGVGNGLQEYMGDNFPGFNLLNRISGNINQGQESNPESFNCPGGNLIFGLNWGGSALKLSLYSPDGRLYTEALGTAPPLVITVIDAAPGVWSYTVTGVDVPHDNYQYATMVGQIALAHQGSDRYRTAVAISQAGWQDGADTVLLARADSFADSLAGVSLAYQLDAPILLTAPNALIASTADEIRRLGAKRVIILGGYGAVSADVEAALGEIVSTVDRLGGANRYETAKLVAEELAKGGAFDTAFIAVGTDFPDALAVASYAALQGFPILLTESASIPAATSEALNELGVKNTIIVGGTGVISADVMNLLPNPVRIAGTNRYTTALTLAEEYLPEGTKHIYLATGLSFPDALAGSVLAAKGQSGIILLPGNQAKLPGYLADFINAKGIELITIFGGNSAVSQGIKDDLRDLFK